MAGSSTKVIVAALIGNSLIAVTKFIASAMTGSSAMFAEGVHSLVDTGNQVLLLYGLKQARRPPDARFPFGHGKEVYFWSFIVAILIFAVGAGISIYEGVHRLSDPQPVTSPIINYIVLSLAIVFEGAAWLYAWRAFARVRGEWGLVEAVQRGKDPSMFVVLFEDSAAMLGLLIALGALALGDITGNPVFDGLASILIGLVLAATAAWLAFETKSLLIGEAANRYVVDDLRARTLRSPGVNRVNEILTLHMGPDFIVALLSVEFDDAARTDDIENYIAKIDGEIKRAHPVIKRVFIEAEAWQSLPG
ncbi:MAG: cation transporter [Gammaproteobacteria bacterium]|nr:cation diffusion facilitator family transporter [Gammaproteobacteria bacterium]NNM00147.1 cation transporter [Gammaproteobacteria bacterium]